MKKLLFLFYGLLISSLSSLVFAQSLELFVTTPSLTVDNPFTIQVKGNQIYSLDGVSITGLEQLEVLGKQVVTNVQIVNGLQQSQHILSLQVVAKKEGSLTLGPASIKQGSGIVNSMPLTINIEPSFHTLQAQLKGTQDIGKPIFPGKVILILFAALLGLYSIWRRYWEKKIKDPKTTRIQEIHERPTPSIATMNWVSKIPADDDPLFAENSEHLIRNYLQSIRNTNVYHLTYQELLQLNSHQQGDLRIPMESLRHALMILQKARYAKLDLDKMGLKEHITRMFS